MTDFDKSNFDEIETNVQKMDIRDFFSNYSEKDIDKLELHNILDSNIHSDNGNVWILLVNQT